jgi:hypothetical protein
VRHALHLSGQSLPNQWHAACALAKVVVCFIPAGTNNVNAVAVRHGTQVAAGEEVAAQLRADKHALLAHGARHKEAASAIVDRIADVRQRTWQAAVLLAWRAAAARQVCACVRACKREQGLSKGCQAPTQSCCGCLRGYSSSVRIWRYALPSPKARLTQWKGSDAMARLKRQPIPIAMVERTL